MMKEFCLGIIHWQMAKDPWTQAIFEAGGLEMDKQIQRIIDIYNFDDFEKIPEKYIPLYEEMLGIVPNDERSMADRRSLISALWKKEMPPTKAAIQAICDSWLNGECEISTGAGYIEIIFGSLYGIPDELDLLKSALAQVVPAHLEIQYSFKYLLIGEVHGVMTIGELAETPLGYFAG